MKRVLIAALCLASCATAPETKIVTRDVMVPVATPCLTVAQRDSLMALLPGDMGPWIDDARQREGRYLERLSKYRSFADAVSAVLPACVATPVATPRPTPEVKL